MKKLLIKLYFFLMDLLAWIQWGFLRDLFFGRSHNITGDDKLKAWDILRKRNAIILTYSKSHLSSHASRLGHTLLTGDKATYSHALLNVEPDGTNFLLVEAISKGVVISSFNEVFDCDGFCILVPKNYSQEEFDQCVWDYRSEVGKDYDNFFKLFDPNARSCIEVVFAKLQQLLFYKERMPVLDYLINKEKNLTPEMLRQCPDFEVLLEVKR